MNEEQINEAMRLGELWAAYAWKACSHGADETVKSQAGRAALEVYLRTIGEPESVNAELLEALEGMIYGAASCAVPHEGERKALQMAVDHALPVITKARNAQ